MTWHTYLLFKLRATTAVATMTGQVPRRKSSVPSWVTPACPSGASAERSCFPPHSQKVFAGPREASLMVHRQSSAEGMPMVRPAQAGTMVRGTATMVQARQPWTTPGKMSAVLCVASLHSAKNDNNIEILYI